MKRNIWIDLTIVILLLVALGVLIKIAVVAKEEGTQCMLNPLVFGAKQIEENSGYEVIGSINSLNPNIKGTVSFNSKEIWGESNIESETTYPTLNLSKIFIDG